MIMEEIIITIDPAQATNCLVGLLVAIMVFIGGYALGYWQKTSNVKREQTKENE